MKRLLLVVAVAMMAAGAGAQERQKFWAGGTLGFSQTDFYGNSDIMTSGSSFTVLPEFGYNFSNRWAAGIKLGFAQTEIGYASSMQTFIVSPFARYTYLNWRALSLFADGGIDFSSADGRVSADGSTIDGGHVVGCGLFVNPGLSVRVFKNISLVGRTNMSLFTAGYSEAEMYGDSDTDTDIWHFSMNPDFSLKSLVNNLTFGVVVTF